MSLSPSTPVAWLPSATLASARTARPVVSAVEAWSGRWFSSGGWRAATGFVRVEGDDWPALRQGDGVDLTGRPKAMQELALAIVGGRARGDLTPADDKLLRRIAGAALDDLHAAIEAACPAAATDGPRWRLTIGPGTGGTIALDIAQAALAGIARQTFARVAPAPALSSRREAAAGQAVTCAAHLGRATLSVQQVEALEPGDVVVLDLPVDAIVPLAVAGRRSDLRIALDGGATTTSLQD